MSSANKHVKYNMVYHISWIFRAGLIFAEFATSLKSPKIDTAKNKPSYTSSLRVLEIAKIGLSENLTHLPSGIFAKISQREQFPIYGMWLVLLLFFQDLWVPKILSIWPVTCFPNIKRDHLLISDYLPTKFEASGQKHSWVMGAWGVSDR